MQTDTSFKPLGMTILIKKFLSFHIAISIDKYQLFSQLCKESFNNTHQHKPQTAQKCNFNGKIHIFSKLPLTAALTSIYCFLGYENPALTLHSNFKRKNPIFPNCH
jgi:hypothetical protein